MGWVEIIPAEHWDKCDVCNQPFVKAEGSQISNDGLSLIWLCERCTKANYGQPS